MLLLEILVGKSTLLQAIAVGQYDKIPGDGRELCVSLHDSVTVRAEDGRYVNNWYVVLYNTITNLENLDMTWQSNSDFLSDTQFLYIVTSLKQH